MDIEKQKRRKVLRVVLVDSVMVLAITVLVIILVLVVSGYRVKDGLVLEQAGLLQVISLPDDAQVNLNGEKVGKTEFNRMLDEGTYNVSLYKDGYESWHKDVKITPGWLMRINYARLLLQNRTEEVIRQFDELDFLAVSADRNNLLYSNGFTTWHQMKINNDDVSVINIELANSLNDFVRDGKFVGRVEIVFWSKNNERVIAKVYDDNKIQWIAVNLKKPEDSVNITKKFGLNITKITAQNNSADKLFALINGNLQEIDLKRGELSEIVLADVADYNNSGTDVIYVSQSDEKNQRVVGLLKPGETEAAVIYTAEEPEKSVMATVTKYAGKDYSVFMVGDRLYIYEGEQAKLVAENDTGIMPGALAVSDNGEFVFSKKDKTVLMIDLELMDYHFYDVNSEKLYWADDYMLEEVVDGKINVFDFDGANRRVLSAADGNFPAAFSENNKYIYYIVHSGEKYELAREVIK